MMAKHILFIILFFGLSFNVSALHEVRPAYLQIKQIDETTYEVFWKVPSLDTAVPKINPVFPESFNVEQLNLPNFTGSSAIFSYIIKSKTSLAGKTIIIDGLNKTLIDALVTITYLNGETITIMLQPDKDSAIIPGESKRFEVIKSYSILGIEHILFGFDHLLFVLALLLLANSKWKLLKTITAFTIAHSITLTLSVLNVVHIPGPPVEAVIALSIVFLALEIITNIKGKETLTGKKPWLVAFIFGLLHGFGFAGALTEIGLPQKDIPLALGFFNVGVEIGQLLFVIFMIGVLYFLQKVKINKLHTQRLIAYSIGGLAMFWLIDRINGFIM